MNTQRLRRPEIGWMTQCRQSGELTVHASADRAPARCRVIAAEPVFTFLREKQNVLLDPPLGMAADADAAITVLRKDQLAGRSALLRGYKIEHRVTLHAECAAINRDFPNLVQRSFRLRTAQI